MCPGCTPSSAVPASSCECPPPAQPVGPALLPPLSVFGEDKIGQWIYLKAGRSNNAHPTLN